MKLSFFEFEMLTLDLLYSIMMLRQQVFVVEQQSIYTDLDGLDHKALHLCAQDYESHELMGYARLRLDHTSKVAKIERVVIGQHYRGKGLANQLMQACIDKSVLQQMSVIKLSAQLDVIAYYKKWGFVAEGDIYDDGGIDHRDMLKKIEE